MTPTLPKRGTKWRLLSLDPKHPDSMIIQVIGTEKSPDGVEWVIYRNFWGKFQRMHGDLWKNRVAHEYVVPLEYPVNQEKQLRQFIRREIHEALSSIDSEIGTRASEEDRAPIGQKVIDQVRKNNPELEDFEREMERDMNGRPQERTRGVY